MSDLKVRPPCTLCCVRCGKVCEEVVLKFLLDKKSVEVVGQKKSVEVVGKKEGWHLSAINLLDEAV